MTSDNEQKLFSTAKTLVREIAKFGITCDIAALERLHAFTSILTRKMLRLQHSIEFTKALTESRRDQYIEAGNKIEKLDQCSTGRRKSMTYALMTIGSIFSKDAFDLENEPI